ncbi:valine--tRNA ligase [Candidatus Dependentiae bacterium]|nr:MAG: valine--tRNA ligase [Candidatus Dependentiae bacterium]
MDKRYDSTSSEKKVRTFWQEQDIFNAANNPGPSYTIDTPPPTVSGALHVGHIFSYTQTDIIARYKRINGFSVVYPFGFDDNGLPTERYVEKKLNIKATDFERSKFIELCLKETKEAEQEFKELWQRMGLSVDWDLQYTTISPEVRRLSQASFIELFNKGFVYRKEEPALYCPVCQTSVAQAELEDSQVESFFSDIVFTDEDGNQLIIGTTRPELLPSCVALFYNPADERYKKLKGKKARVPLFKTEIPILEDELVAMEKGTGLVMCCTFGDTTDIAWYKKHRLPYKQSIGRDGKMTELAGMLKGLSIHEARKKIIQELIKHNLLIRQQPITHVVNIHERCKNEIEFIALKQWFIKILEHKQAFLEQANKIKWYPAFMKARYKDWVEHIGWDWCISRQRFYGIPFPVWYCTECDKVLIAEPKELPVDPQETKYKGACSSCGSKNIVPDTDVMDTWNTSSLTPYICYAVCNQQWKPPFQDEEQKETLESFLPMNMRPQAHDIIRTWAFYTIVKSWMHNNLIPWNTIIISGHVLGAAKEKLSKSKGGGPITPENLLANYSADALRYWTASAALGHDVSFSEEQIQIGQRLTTKLWNAFRFIKEHLAPCKSDEVPEQLGSINGWILHQASNCFETYQNYLEQNEFSIALDNVEQFFWKDFCDNYLEIIKDQLFNSDKYNHAQICATQWTLFTIGLRILQLYAPYVPYVTEAIYQLLYKEHVGIASIHQTRFSKVQQLFVFKKGAKSTEKLLEIVSQVRKLKSKQQLSLKTKLATLTIYVADIDNYYFLQEQEQLIKGVTQAQKVHFKQEERDEQRLKQQDNQWNATVSC